MDIRKQLKYLFPALAVLALPLLAFQQWRFTERLAEDDARRISSFLETGTRAVASEFDKSVSDLVHEIGSTVPFDSSSILNAASRWESRQKTTDLIQNIWLISTTQPAVLKPLLRNSLPDSALAVRISELASTPFSSEPFSARMNGFYFEKQAFVAISPIQIQEETNPPFVIALFDSARLVSGFIQPLIDSLLEIPSRERIFWDIQRDSTSLIHPEPIAFADSADFRTNIGTVSTMRIVIMSSDTRDSLKFTWTKSKVPDLKSVSVFRTNTQIAEKAVMNVKQVLTSDLMVRTDSTKILTRFSGLPPILPELPSRPMLVVQYGETGISGAVTARKHRDFGINAIILFVLATGITFSIRSARTAEKLARRQMEFVSTVTHELRTPVAVIKSAAQNMSDGLVSSPDRTVTYGNLITDESRRLGDLIENVLAFSGLSSNSVSLKRATFDASSLLADVISSLRQAAKSKNLILNEDISSGTTLFADAHGFRLIFSNLIENAIKYSNPGGTVSITLKADAKAVHFVVQDHGMGISSADLPHIFEPFRRGKHAVEQQIKGSGLGLHLVKKYADLHGASIAVESVIRTGSTFSVHFPVQPETTA